MRIEDRVRRLEAVQAQTKPAALVTPLMREVREIDEEMRTLDAEMAVLEAAMPEKERRREEADDAAFVASLNGLSLDEKIAAHEEEIAHMEGGPWEA